MCVLLSQEVFFTDLSPPRLVNVLVYLDGDSLSVEISSYVILATLSSPSVPTADLGYASRIVRWLVSAERLWRLLRYNTHHRGGQFWSLVA